MTLGRRAFTIAGLAVAAGAALTGCAANARKTSTLARIPPIGDFVEVNGARVHYFQEGTGPDLVLLHGAGGNLREFTLQHVDLLKDRYRVTCFDRPGLGYTDRHPDIDDSVFSSEGESPQQQAQMLRDAASQLGIKNPIVGGHSFGGIVAMAWAVLGLDTQADVNAAGVVSMAGVLMPWPGGLGAYYTINSSPIGGAITVPLISALASKSQINDAIDGVFAPQAPPVGYRAYAGAELAVRPDVFRANVRQVSGSRPHVVELSQRYPELTIPIEIVHGTADTTVPITVHADEIIKILPSVNITRLEGVGHMPHHADIDATLAAIDAAASRAGLR
jgi:pimeloyl-ACP methyl ester carboxylesterase